MLFTVVAGHASRVLLGERRSGNGSRHGIELVASHAFTPPAALILGVQVVDAVVVIAAIVARKVTTGWETAKRSPVRTDKRPRSSTGTRASAVARKSRGL